MKSNPSRVTRKRSYDASSRTQAAQARRERCIEIFAELLGTDWYRDITLESVAEEAGITVPTLLRYFGSKEGLLELAAIHRTAQYGEQRNASVGDVPAIVQGVVRSYERLGDYTLRLQIQEERIPVLQSFTRAGRRDHRRMVRESFAPYFEGLSKAEAEHTLDELAAALDIYVWKVLRRDRKRSAADVREFMEMAVSAILAKRSRAAARKE